MSRWAVVVALVIAAAAGAVVLNVLLLGRVSSGNDPVGRLRPQAHLPPAPASVVRPSSGPVERDSRDD